MTKKKRIITRLLVVLAALTLISCCFLGSTFARYTSSNSGKASVNVAKWEVSVTGTGVGETAVSFGNLSAPKAEWKSGETRSLSTEDTLVATITNNSAVAAEITVNQGAIKLDPESFPEGSAYTVDQAKSVFSVTLSYSKNDETAKTAITDATKLVIAGKEGTAPADALPQATTIKIYAKVTWTTQDTGNPDGTLGDKLDTFVGENVTSVEVPVTYKAVQVTEVNAPSTPATPAE